MDKLAFYEACDKIINHEREKNGIGTLGEKTLHAVLKNYFEPHTDCQEIKVGGFVADIVNEKGVIEIQTRQFGKLLKKLEAFLEYSDVTVVFPMAKMKYLKWLDTDTGELKDGRKSPRKAKIYDVMPELYHIKFTLDNPRFHLCLCMLEIDEIKYLNGWSKDRKKGSSKCDRIPKDLLDEIYINCPQDFSIFIPPALPQEFTSSSFAKYAGINVSLAQITLNILSYLNLVDKIGKDGRKILYRRNEHF